MTAFASDNYAPAHPDVLAAVVAANEGHAGSYGADPWTARAVECLRGHLGAEAEVFLVFNGTAANVLCLQALLRPYEAVICAESAHIAVDEGGAPERILGSKLIAVPTPDGKLTPELVDQRIVRLGDEHAVQPKVVSIAQTSELGTRYELDEVRALADLAHARGLLLHVDGARIANAAAALGVGLREATADLGVDALSLGATKNGALGAEAVVLFDRAHAEGFPWWRKQTMQLASKMRYAAAQLEALFAGDLWLRNAAHANAMAQRLAAAVADVPGVRIVRPVQANAVFAVLAPAVTRRLQERFAFYVWDELTGEVRWMCSWDTTEADVDAFAAAVADEAAGLARR
ncbi:MAG: threonine aldolase [Solirubrobacteraceae bacterium]|nr:threonine aldolase [Solirubrobacteraceae bacterium]